MAGAQTRQRPAAKKQRRTSVAVQWFFDTYASGDEPSWRFHPTDMSHRAARPPQMDEDGNPLGMEQRPWEVKGWVPAQQALATIPDAREALNGAPEPVRRIADAMGPFDGSDNDGKAA